MLSPPEYWVQCLSTQPVHHMTKLVKIRFYLNMFQTKHLSFKQLFFIIFKKRNEREMLEDFRLNVDAGGNF